MIELRSFTSSQDVADYWQELVSHDMDYHLDDDPAEIVWNDCQMSEAQLKVLIENHNRMWNYAQTSADIWDHIDLTICQQ